MSRERTEATKKCVSMIWEGYTKSEIAAATGKTEEGVYSTARRYGIDDILKNTTRNKLSSGVTCIYPEIAKYILEHYNGHRRDFWMALNCGTDPTNRRILEGERLPNKAWIDAVLRLTGMTYEEAFRTE